MNPATVDPTAGPGADSPGDRRPAGTPDGGEPARTLPRGRHNLSREQIEASQRSRLLAAMIAEVGARGYPAATASGVYARAGVSSRSFYELFENKEQCYLEAYEFAVTHFTATIREDLAVAAETEGPVTPLAQFRRLIGAYLGALAADTGFARMGLVEIFAAGPTALRRRDVTQQVFIDLVHRTLWPAETPTGSDPTPLSEREHHFAAEAVVASVTFLVTSRVARGETRELTSLLEPVMGFVAGVL